MKSMKPKGTPPKQKNQSPRIKIRSRRRRLALHARAKTNLHPQTTATLAPPLQKSQGKEIQDQVEWERMREENRRSQIVRAAEWRVRTCFGFFPNLTLSIHKNARAVMGDMSPGCYFLKAANTTFHDLTKAKLLPPAAASLLGLSLKFIPTPCYSPSLFDVTPLTVSNKMLA